MLISIPENILLFFSCFGIVQGFLLAGLLYFYPKADKSVTGYLAAYIFCISFPSITLIVNYYFTWHVILFIQPFLLLMAPLLYLYVRSFKEVITLGKAWPHFILFILYFFVIYWLYEDVGRQYPSGKTVPPEVLRHPLYYIQIAVRSLQRIVYFFLSYKVLLSYQRSIRHLFSDTSRINLRWVKWLINGYLVLVLTIISFNIMVLKYPELYNLWTLIIGTMVTIYVCIAAVKGIAQPTLWQVQSTLSKEQIETKMQEAEKIDAKQSIYADKKTNEIVSRIISLLNHDKLYQEPELTLQNLADKLQVPSYQVSQGINEGLNKTFYDLINSYRVEEAKRLLLDSRNKNYTIISVGFEAGFNSKTTFNTVFKKFTGLTPTEYRDKQTAIQV